MGIGRLVVELGIQVEGKMTAAVSEELLCDDVLVWKQLTGMYACLKRTGTE